MELAGTRTGCCCCRCRCCCRRRHPRLTISAGGFVLGALLITLLLCNAPSTSGHATTEPKSGQGPQWPPTEPEAAVPNRRSAGPNEGPYSKEAKFEMSKTMEPKRTAEAAGDGSDVVISSSETLHRPLVNQRPNLSRPAANADDELQSNDQAKHQAPTVRLEEPSNVADSDASNAASVDGESSPDGDPEQPAPPAGSGRESSRLLLRMLVFGMFALLSSSLVIVYAIKFCVCSRRKRRHLLRGALVGDVGEQRRARQIEDFLFAPAGPSPSSQHFLAGETNCACARNHSSRRNNHLLAHPADQLVLESLLRASAGRQSPIGWPLSGDELELATVCRQVALAAQLQARSTSGGCPCASDGPETPPARPPAYSELFEVVATAEPAPGAAATTTTTCTTVEGGLTSGPSVDVSSLSNPSDCQREGLPTSRADQSQQVNLLVRLNLNKTKLLSAADLMLLSKLIDVPIVVQPAASAPVASQGAISPTGIDVEECLARCRPANQRSDGSGEGGDGDGDPEEP